MHASVAALLFLYEGYLIVRISLGYATKAKQSGAPSRVLRYGSTHLCNSSEVGSGVDCSGASHLAFIPHSEERGGRGTWGGGAGGASQDHFLPVGKEGGRPANAP